jgi:hypothetical protein
MRDAYQAKIDASKAPKKWADVKNILNWLQLGIRNGYDTKTLCDKLNARRIKTLTGGTWSMNSLQMQILKMARLEDDSSLARGWAYLMKLGQVTEQDMALLQDRVR